MAQAVLAECDKRGFKGRCKLPTKKLPTPLRLGASQKLLFPLTLKQIVHKRKEPSSLPSACLPWLNSRDGAAHKKPSKWSHKCAITKLQSSRRYQEEDGVQPARRRGVAWLWKCLFMQFFTSIASQKAVKFNCLANWPGGGVWPTRFDSSPLLSGKVTVFEFHNKLPQIEDFGHCLPEDSDKSCNCASCHQKVAY